jgi:hypothetical protein
MMLFNIKSEHGSETIGVYRILDAGSPGGGTKALGSKMLEAQGMSKFIPDADSTWRTW